MMSVTRFRMVILSGLKSKRCACRMSRGSYIDYQRLEHFENVEGLVAKANKNVGSKHGILEILGAPSGLRKAP